MLIKVCILLSVIKLQQFRTSISSLESRIKLLPGEWCVLLQQKHVLLEELEERFVLFQQRYSPLLRIVTLYGVAVTTISEWRYSPLFRIVTHL